MAAGLLSHFSFDPRATGDALCSRTVWGIVWSCLSTLFTCTWVAIHPNAASEMETSAVVVFRRLGLMVTMLVAPEMVVCWALRQRILATFYAEKFKDYPRGTKWTRVHGFFLIMGGFTYYTDDGTLETLTASKMEELYKKCEIEWPTVTAKQIRDRSKADLLAKVIVMGQATWFCLQLLARWKMHLAVAELEISTVAFAVINLIVYALWLEKPFDVRSHVIVQRIPPPCVQCNATTSHAHTHARSDSVANEVNATTDSSRLLTSYPSVSEKGEGSIVDEFHGEKQGVKKLRWRTYLKNKFTHAWRLLRECDMEGFIAVLLAPVAILYGIFGSPFVSLYVEKGNHLRSPKDPYDSEDARSKHPRWKWLFNLSAQLALVSFVGIIFGGLHLIAWSFAFPTLAEKGLWRASSLALIVPPILLQLRWILNIEKKGILASHPILHQIVIILYMVLVAVSVLSYMAARFILSIIAIISLRSAAPGVFVNIQWTSFLPHF